MPKPGSRPTIHSRLVAIACLLGLVLFGLPPLAAYADSFTPRQHDGVASAGHRQPPLPADAAVPARWKGVRDDALSRVERVRRELQSGGLASAVRAAAGLAEISLDPPTRQRLSGLSLQSPPETAATVESLVAAVQQADAAARRAVTGDGGDLLGMNARIETILADLNSELLSGRSGHVAAKRMETITTRLERQVDRQAMYSAALALADAIDQALPSLEAYAQTLPSSTLAAEGCDVVDLPQLCIGGVGTNTYETDEALLIDLGGDDVYTNSAGGADARHLLDYPGGNGLAASVNIDLGGNDSYDAKLPGSSAGLPSVAQGAGQVGIGMLLDAGGNDSYSVTAPGEAAGQGFGGAGVGILEDLGGNDSYRVSAPSIAAGQGSAQPAGAGLLIDEGLGDDSYSLESSSLVEGIGYAVTLGTAIFSDDGGNDTMKLLSNDYGARGFGTAVVKAKAVALSGVGHTTWSATVGSAAPTGEATAGFGSHVWALGWGWVAGFGALSDAGGDDSYSATVASRVELHRTIDDSCNCSEDEWTASAAGGRVLAGGFGINVATGLLHDALGDDRYDFSVTSIAAMELDDQRTAPSPDAAAIVARARTAETRIWGQGFGSDGGMGLLVDDSGNDAYDATAKSIAGSRVTELAPSPAAPQAVAESGNAVSRTQGFGQSGGYGELYDAGGVDAYSSSASSNATADQTKLASAGTAESRAQGAVGTRSQFYSSGANPSTARFVDVGDIAPDTFEHLPARPACVGTRGAGLWRDCGYGDGVGFNPGQPSPAETPSPTPTPTPSSCEPLFTAPADDARNDAPAGDGGNLDYLDVVGGWVTKSSPSLMTVEIQVKDLEATVPDNATYAAWFFQWTYDHLPGDGQPPVDYWANAVVDRGFGDPSFAVGSINQGKYYAIDDATGRFNLGPRGTIEIIVGDQAAPPAEATITDIHATTWIGVRQTETYTAPFNNITVNGPQGSRVDRGPYDNDTYGADYTVGSDCTATVTPVPTPAPSASASPSPACPPLFASPAGDAPNDAPGGDGGNVDNLDIVSGSLESQGSDAVVAKIQLKDLQLTTPANATYSTWYSQWSYDGTDYWAGATLEKGASQPSYSVGTVASGNYGTTASTTGSFTTGANGSIEIKVPRDSIGIPRRGEGAILTKTYATTWVGLGAAGNGFLSPIDRGPKDDSTYGADYTLGEPCGTPNPDPSSSPSSSPTYEPPPPTRGAYPIVPDDPYFGPGDDVDPLGLTQYGTQWGPQKINAPQAWQEDQATGYRVKVAVLDTGVDASHEDLGCSGKIKVVAGSDPVANDSDPNDENGHGTHVAGIIGACTNNGVGMAGVAPDATIMPIRVLDEEGSGTSDQLIAGINKAAGAGAAVINLSLSYGPVSGTDLFDFQEIDDAIETASAQGVVIVAAAGNDRFPLCEYPSLAKDIVCVGATDTRDNKSWYSTFANKAMRGGAALVAPGGAGTVFCDIDSEDILSLYPAALAPSNDCDERPGYENMSGTSMAAPHVAGAAALVYDRLGGVRSPENAAKVIQALTSTAVDLGAPGYDPIYGSGRIDALAAVCAVGSACDGGVDPSASPSTDPSASPSTDPSASPSTDPSASPTTDPAPVAPEAPSNLTARAASSSRIELAWTDNSSSESGFTIERSLDGSQWSEIGTSGRNATTYLDMGLDPDTSYFYRVRALNPSGYSPYSNIASATTSKEQSGPSGVQAPAAPTSLSATSSSPSRVELSWTDNSTNEDGFALERSTGSTWQEIATTGRNQTTYLDTGLTADTTYEYRARAYNSSGHSIYSNVSSAKTQAAPGDNGGSPSPSPTQSSPPVTPAPVGTATTSIASSDSLTTYNEGFELSGMVERDDNCTGPLEVSISRRVHGTNAYDTVASTPVNGAGQWGLQVVAGRNASYIAQVNKTDTCQGDASVPTDVLVKAKISVREPKVCAGAIRGQVLPSYEGSKVILQRKGRGGWNQVASTTLDGDSRFSLRSKRCGLYRVTWDEEGAANEGASRRLRL